MSRQRIPLSDCGLLSRTNARRFVGCLGDERFTREVEPHVQPRLIGKERFYRVEELRAWVYSDRRSLYTDEQDFMELVRRANTTGQGGSPPNRKGQAILLSPGDRDAAAQ